jgi:hypothetical protein
MHSNKACPKATVKSREIFKLNIRMYDTCSLNSYVDLLVGRMRDAISTKCYPWAVSTKWN